MSRLIPNPDSEMVSQIHVTVIAPQTNKRVVKSTCLTLQDQEMCYKGYPFSFGKDACHLAKRIHLIYMISIINQTNKLFLKQIVQIK